MKLSEKEIKSIKDMHTNGTCYTSRQCNNWNCKTDCAFDSDICTLICTLCNAIETLQQEKDICIIWNEAHMKARVEQSKEIERLKQWVNDLQSGMYVNCVYCGHRYGPKKDTPVSMADILKAHIEQCPEHPMSKLQQQLSDLQKRYGDLAISRDEFADRADRLGKEIAEWRNELYSEQQPRNEWYMMYSKQHDEVLELGKILVYKYKALELAREALLAAKPHVDIHSDPSPLLVNKALAAIENTLIGNNAKSAEAMSKEIEKASALELAREVIKRAMNDLHDLSPKPKAGGQVMNLYAKDQGYLLDALAAIDKALGGNEKNV